MSAPATKLDRANFKAKVKTRVWPWVLLGLMIVAMAGGGVASWGATIPLASAIIATGQITVDTNRKQVQHLEGGIVDELRVRDGDFVKAGDILIRLDETRAKASLGIVASAYREERAKEARLIAERDEKNEIAWPQDLLKSSADPALKSLIASQQSIYDSRKETLQGEYEILRERISQLEQEIEGLEAQKSAGKKQSAFIHEELSALETLFAEGRTTKPRMLALQRQAARLEGEDGEFTANIARARKTIGETKLEIIQKRKNFRNNVVSDLRDVQAKRNDLKERLVAAQDVLRRLDIRAPTAGRVVNLAVHAKQSVVKPGDTILEIVPSDDRLLVEVHVNPQDRDNIIIGQEAEIKLLAFKQRTTPALKGRVHYVSADALHNRQQGSSFYIARVEVPESELHRLQGNKLQPGMPAEVMIRTGERTAIAYLVQPLVDSMNHAWREE